MKNVVSVFVICFSLLIVKAYSQNDIKSHNYVTIYLIDNSEGSSAQALNDEMIIQLKESITRISKRPESYFYCYASNGEEYYNSSNVNTILESSGFKKYLRNPSIESDYSFDKKIIREYFTDNPQRAKQNIEVTIFLSAYATKRMMKEMESLPTPIFLAKEIPLYFTNENLKDMNVKYTYYINKEAKELLGEEQIKRSLNFSNNALNFTSSKFEIIFL